MYGGANLASLDLNNLGTRGFRIDGAAQGDRAGYSVAAAGDVNGDGIADVVVGANNADENGNANSGAAYVIYGQSTPEPLDVNLAALGSRGMEIDGAAVDNLAGYSVAGLGDVNGDRVDDIIIGAPGPDTSPGSVYVIYGQSTPDPADLNLTTGLSTNPARGIEIDGGAAGDGTGEAVAGPGDVNDDNHPDLLVSAPDAASGAGRVYVIYGSGQNLASLDLSQENLGSAGFRTNGALAGDNLGESSNLVAGAGDDVNGDGIHDVIVGARFADNNGRMDSGSAYVIYGNNTADPGNVDLANIKGTQALRGMEIDGATAGENAGTAVAGAGDVNGDGIPDFLAGARFADYGGTNSGPTYVVYGGQNGQKVADPADLDLATVTTNAGDSGIADRRRRRR